MPIDVVSRRIRCPKAINLRLSQDPKQKAGDQLTSQFIISPFSRIRSIFFGLLPVYANGKQIFQWSSGRSGDFFGENPIQIISFDQHSINFNGIRLVVDDRPSRVFSPATHKKHFISVRFDFPLC